MSWFILYILIVFAIFYSLDQSELPEKPSRSEALLYALIWPATFLFIFVVGFAIFVELWWSGKLSGENKNDRK